MAFKLKTTILLAVALTSMTGINAASTDLSSALSACKNITAQQRQMAKAAGYDIESLCSAASNAATVTDTSRPQVVIPGIAEYRTTESALEQSIALSGQALSAQALTKKPRQRLFDEFGQEILELDSELLDEDEDKILKQFGYDLFAGAPTTFAPATEIPVVNNYMIGPGDSIKVQLFGKTSENFTLVVSRDGTVQFPELGPISLAGLTFQEMKSLLIERISTQMIGVQASITLGELRSIRIFILGDATQPGSYTVSSLSTMTNALFVSGGVRKIGSLRNIQLKRQGELVSTLDLYDLLLKGDTSKDVRLLPGDVIFIPPVGKTAGVAGEVKRPAIYELKNENNVKQLVALAGGYLPSAYTSASSLQRINHQGDRTLVDVDLKTEKGRATHLANGDVLHIYSVLEKMENIVTIEGHVYRPGGFSFKAGMRVSDLIGSISNTKPAPDLDYALLVREMQPTREIEVIQISLRDVFEDLNSDANIALTARDRLIIFDTNGERTELIEPLLEQLQAQERRGKPARVVTVSGAIHVEGNYPLTEKMSVQELIFAGGGLKESTYVSSAEITRKDYSNPEQASIEHFSVSLTDKNAQAIRLKEGDHLTLKVIPRFQESLTVILKGEVKFPGSYEFTRGETLSDIVERAGGLTNLAHVEATYFSRKHLKAKEAEQIDEFKERLQSDIAASQLKDSNSGKSTDVATLNGLLEEIETSEATGRLVINLTAILNHDVEDVQLRDGDSLIIPTYRQEITIIGEVQNPTSHLYNTVSDHIDYIERSGGTTEKADEDRIYVIKADGSVFLPEKRGWFHDDVTISPGDTIVVPVEVDSMDNLTLWTSISQIIYQMSLGAAAINSF